MSAIWRFYVDEAGEWRWQQLTADRAVVAESRAAFAQYDTCVADAQVRGYKTQATELKLADKPSKRR
jgi:hypothetical protein